MPYALSLLTGLNLELGSEPHVHGPVGPARLPAGRVSQADMARDWEYMPGGSTCLGGEHDSRGYMYMPWYMH